MKKIFWNPVTKELIIDPHCDLLDCFCVDLNEFDVSKYGSSSSFYAYGNFVVSDSKDKQECEKDPTLVNIISEWAHIPYVLFPQEFKDRLLLLGIEEIK